MRIIVADDDPVIRDVIGAGVTKLGHQCITAGSGDAAWELHLASPADVIITDWMMPGLDGLELCRRVRQHAGLHYAYILVTSGRSERMDVLSGMRAGADGYLAKPVDLADVEIALIAASRVTRLHRRLAGQWQELEGANRELAASARTDVLTGLGNRRRMLEDLETLSARATRYQQGFWVALGDIDHFKEYNDTYGHVAGDAVLHTVGEEITRGRATDAGYRYGGDEFLVVFPAQTPVSAGLAADRLRMRIANFAIPHTGNPPVGLVTISVGLAEARSGAAAAPQQLLEQADLALYQAKAAGRNSVALFAPDQPTAAV